MTSLNKGISLQQLKYNLPLFLALVAAGLAGNYFKFPVFLNIDFLFGSIFAMLALQFLGPVQGILAAAIISIYTYILWNHPYAIIIMTAEVAVVGWLMGRRKMGMVLADTLYWLIIGTPLIYIFYHVAMHVPFSNASIVMTKQSVNGIANTLVARLVFTGFGLRLRASLTSFSELVCNLLALFVLCPALIMLAVGSRTDFAETDRQIRTSLIQDSQLMNQYLENWVENRESAIVTLAEMAASRSPQQMQSYLELAKRSDANFLRIGLLDREATITAYFPLLDELGHENIGKNFTDRPFIPTLKRTLKPMLSEVVMGRIGTPKPMITMLVPVVIDGEYGGYVTGILSLEQIREHLNKSKHENATLYTLIDKNGNVIMTSRTDQKVMTHFVRGSGTINHLDAGICQWVPVVPPNTSIMERWKSSFYVAETAIGRMAEWKLILEQPVAPFQKMLYDNYTGKLTLLFLILLGALVLAELLNRRSIVTLEKLRKITRDLPGRLSTDGKGKEIAWPESRIIEMEALCHNFREMALALTASFHEQKILNETLEKQVIKRTEALRESEERLRFALESALIGIFDYQPVSGVIFLDEQTKQHWGILKPGMQLNYSELIARLHPEDKERVEHEIKLALEPGSDGFFESEYRIYWPDGLIHWAIVKGRVYFEGEGANRRAVHMIGIHLDYTLRKQTEVELALYREHLEMLIEDRTRQLMENNELLSTEIAERKLVEDELRNSREQLRTLASRLQAAREEERIGIAREIHDVLAQELTRLKFDLVWLQRRLTHPENRLDTESLLDRISEMGQITDTAIQSVQKIATELRPAVLDSLGLCAAVEWQARDFQTRSGILCRANVPGEEPPIGKDAATAIFRILQESLTNVLRHAGASRVDLLLQQEENHLLFIVRDNGCGVAPETISDPLSIGLTGMRERALLLGGQFFIRGRPESGTIIEVRIPLFKKMDLSEDRS